MSLIREARASVELDGETQSYPSCVVIGIDPGPEQSAYCILRGAEITKHGKISNEVLLAEIANAFSRSANGDAAIFIEMVASFGMPVGHEVFETCRWVGRIEECLKWCDYHKPTLLYRHEVKMHWCKSTRAKDANIRQALIDAYGKPGTKKNPGPTYGISGDCWSALAVAGLGAFRLQTPPGGKE